MTNLYSVCVTISEYWEEVEDQQFFVGIFDEQHLKDGIKEFVRIKEREDSKENISDKEFEERLKDEFDDTDVERILHDSEYILNILGTCYFFFIGETECNSVNNTLIGYCNKEGGHKNGTEYHQIF